MTNTTTQSNTFTKLRSGAWGIKGRSLMAGAPADIRKRDGKFTTVTVGRILWTGADGTSIASIAGEDKPAATSSRSGCRGPRRRVNTTFVNGICQSCGCEAWDCDC